MGKKDKSRRKVRASQLRGWCIDRLRERKAKGDGRSWWCWSDKEIAGMLGLPCISRSVAREALEAAYFAAGDSGLPTRPVKRRKKVDGETNVAAVEFLQTYEWRRVRMEAIKLHGARCQCCGASPTTGAVLNVDHIKPRKIYPELALSLDNLQVLCGECNHGKGNWDMTDWRAKEEAHG